MIIILLVIGAGFKFYKLADEAGLPKWLWAFMPLICYLGIAVTAGLILGMYYGSIFNSVGATLGLELGALVVGLGLAYGLLTIAINKKKAEFEDNDIIDTL